MISKNVKRQCHLSTLVVVWIPGDTLGIIYQIHASGMNIRRKIHVDGLELIFLIWFMRQV